MKFVKILVAIVIAAGVCSGETGLTAQDSGVDALYSRFEDYDATTPRDKIRARLDALAEHLKINPSLRLLLISYGGRESCRNEAVLRARLATRYLSRSHGISSNRSIIRNGGYRDHWVVELWVGSVGATPPQPAKTINRRLVTIKKNCNFSPINGSP